jgi:hypothetical protein
LKIARNFLMTFNFTVFLLPPNTQRSQRLRCTPRLPKTGKIELAVPQIQRDRVSLLNFAQNQSCNNYQKIHLRLAAPIK